MKHLDQNICYQALKTRDARFDGRFFTAVSSTGIFCRPICPATTPKQENCTFYPSASAALSAGYRPCLRCRPETAPNSAAWLGTEAVVKRALRLIEQGALDDGQSVTDLAASLGIGERHLRRLFNDHLGAGPKQIAQTRRLMFAKRLLAQTNISVTEIALSSGFNSLRRFNDAYKTAFGFPPSHERKTRRDTGDSTTITLRFPYRPPYDWDGMLAFFRDRCLEPVEEVSEDTYRRIVRFDGQVGDITLRHEPAKNRLVAQLTNIPVPYVRDVSVRIRRLFDIDADPQAIQQGLSSDPALQPLIKAHPGLRLPGAWDGFEIAVRAIIGQQISVKGARTICKRVIERVNSGIFPTPAEICSHSLDGVGLTQRRINTLKNLAAHWQELDVAKPLENSIADLCALPGIGPWTAHYILMRAFSEPDIYPVQDLGLIRGLEKLGLPAGKHDLEERSQLWRPWRAYGALYLWRA
jgi:AraC family transcriptional regulator of adaptative response / DNA-3-methyladenine glycosylase II